MPESTEEWQEKLRKLMAKAEDSATTEAERDAIVSRVTYLMAKFGIEEAMLSATKSEPQVVINMRVKILAPYAIQRGHLLDHIGRVFGCKSIHLDELDGKVVRIFGYQGDFERTYMLFGSLIIQMFSGLASVVKPAGVHGRSFNGSFVTAYVDTVIDRVKDAYATAKAEVKHTTGNGMELVLADRAIAINNAFRTEYPRLRNIGYNPSQSSSAGRFAGMSAARNANIGQTGISGRKAIGS